MEYHQRKLELENLKIAICDIEILFFFNQVFIHKQLNKEKHLL
jgi:hypothetical protein